MPPSLPTAPLGKGGPQVNRLGIGLMGLSGFYGPTMPDKDRLAFLDGLWELGAHFWDTADVYMDSEDLLNKWFTANPDKRKDIFLATKFANRWGDEGGIYVDSSPEYAKEACNRSLQRLGLPSVELYYCHRLDGKLPIEKTIHALVELKNEGKLKYIGLSECSSESLRRAHAVHPISAVQVEYSPFSLDIETEQIGLLKTARELGVAIVPYSPIGRGMLTGAVRSPDDFSADDFRKLAPRFSAENFPKNLELVDNIIAMGKEKGCTSAQLTLAWLLAQGEDIFPIPGTTKIPRLKENLGALDVKLSNQDIARFRKYCEEAEVVGARYPEAFASALYMDTPPLNA